jgi:asparagine synthase (glutamine-hydrolysing)
MLFQHALLWNTLGDKTIYHNIRSLQPGTVEIHELDGNCTQRRYYEIGDTCLSTPANLEAAIEDFKEVFADAVRLRLRSDVPVATYLSGGIDSSVTTYLVAKIMGARLHSFSVSFKDKEFDESSYQMEMAKLLGSSHLKLDIDYTDIDTNMLKASYHFERPVFRTAGVPLFLLSKKVNDADIKVVVTGEGADEVLCGYDSFKEMKLLDFWSSKPDSTIRPLLIRKLYPHLGYYNNPKQYGLLRMYYEGFLDSHANLLGCLNIRIHNNQIISKFLNKDHRFTVNIDKIEQEIQQLIPDNFSEWTLIQKSQYLEMKTLLSGYLLSSQGDRMSMAHSVEGRYPFLDHRVVEKAFYYNDVFKLNGFSQKHLLKECYKSNIPQSIIDRPKKPYTAPDLKAFVNDGKLSEVAQYFLSAQKIIDFGVFDDIAIGRYLKKFQRQTPDAIGYRDNMLFTFILSTQMICHWIQHPKQITLPIRKKKVDIVEDN